MSSTNKKFGIKRSTELRNASEISVEEMNEIKNINYLGAENLNADNYKLKQEKNIDNINENSENNMIHKPQMKSI